MWQTIKKNRNGQNCTVLFGISPTTYAGAWTAGTSSNTSSVLKKSKNDNKTLFIDASGEFIKITNNNKLTPQNIEKIVGTYIDKEDIPHFAKLVSSGDIAEQDYNLSVGTYVEQKDTREAVDIGELNAEIERIVTREDILRREINAIIAEIEGK